MIGYEFGSYAVAGGLGAYSFPVDSRVRVIPFAEEFRLGAPTGLALVVGFGAPPIASLAQRPSGYWMFRYGFERGGDVALGVTAVIFSPVESRALTNLTGSFPITDRIAVGGVLGIGQSIQGVQGAPKSIAWTAGAHATVRLP